MKKQKATAARAVIYARYSSHNQREASIEQQVNACRQLAARLGLEVVEIYEDKAISGKSDRRPSFQRLLADAEKGAFDCVLAWKSNRIGRNMLQSMINEARLKDCGVRTFYAEEDFDDTAAGRFALRNMMNVNQFYSENMAEDITRGLKDNASKCLCNGQQPLGYRPGPDGRIERDEAGAAIVQEIYSRVACYEPFAEIARDFNRRGIRTSRGGTWNKGSFYSICHNERYRGIYIYGDTRIEGGVPRIVSDALFYRVQEVLKVKKNPQNGRHRSGAEDYLLTGKLFCGKCGSPMTGISGTSRSGELHYYYICQKRRTARTCDKHNVRRDQIERAVALAIRQYMLVDPMIQHMADETMAYNARCAKDLHLQELEEQLAASKASAANVMKAIEMGVITQTTKARLVELEQEQGHLTAQIETARAEMVPITRDDMVSLLYIYKDGDINDKKYLASLFDTFLVRVDLYDDHMKIWFNPMGKQAATDMPFAEDFNDDAVNFDESMNNSAFVLGGERSTTKTRQRFLPGLFCCTYPFAWVKTAPAGEIFKNLLHFVSGCGTILRQYTRIALFFCAFFAVRRQKVRKQKPRSAEGKN